MDGMTRRNKGKLKLRDYQALAGFRHALRQFLAFSEAAAVAAGLTPVQHQALLAIKGMTRADNVSIGDLAAWLGVRHHSCVGLVDRLAKLGLVVRQHDPDDRRRTALRLTVKAGQLLDRLSLAHRDELRRLSGSLGVALADLH
jgi:DNA-binding MarR family transcriptional regulator